MPVFSGFFSSSATAAFVQNDISVGDAAISHKDVILNEGRLPQRTTEVKNPEGLRFADAANVLWFPPFKPKRRLEWGTAELQADNDLWLVTPEIVQVA